MVRACLPVFFSRAMLVADTNAVALAAGVVAVAAGAAFLLRQSLRRQLGAGVTVDTQHDRGACRSCS